jgi:predicted HTH transcriptional regulator
LDWEITELGLLFPILGLHIAKRPRQDYFYPMTFHELQSLVAAGEGLHVEFKQKLPEWPKLMRELVAFANTKGGILLIGVDDDRNISGLKDPREVEEAIFLNLGNWVRPELDYRLEVVHLSQKRAVVGIRVPESKEKPHYALENPAAAEGQVLIRIADNSVRASRETIQLLKFEGRERNLKVEYGEKERLLMQFLEKEGRITVPQFAELAKIPMQIASRTLVHLVKANVLQHKPRIEAQDLFSAVEA